jgi:hypothetical protein
MKRVWCTLTATLLLLHFGCGRSPAQPSLRRASKRTAAPSTEEGRALTAPVTRPGAFSREPLIEDARQLAAILEATHPDPYTNGGGRSAFHRRLLNGIPPEGMTKASSSARSGRSWLGSGTHART